MEIISRGRKKAGIMAKYREIPCKYYIALGQCKKGREACHKKYCQHSDKYCPRAKVRCVNKKKQYNEKIKRRFAVSD